MFLKVNRQWKSRTDVRLLVFIENNVSNENNGSFDRGPICFEEVCYFYCTGFERIGGSVMSDRPESDPESIVLVHEILNEKGEVVRWHFGNIIEVQRGLDCLEWDHRCISVPYFCDDDGGDLPSDLPTDLTESPDNGDSSSGGGSNASLLFHELMNSCPSTPNDIFGNGEGSLDASTCTALRELRECTLQGSGGIGIFTADNFHLIQELIDNNRIESVKEFACNSDSDLRSKELVVEYAEYISFDNSITPEDFFKIAEFLDEEEIEMNTGEFIVTYDVEDCIASSLGCNSSNCTSFRSCITTSAIETLSNNDIALTADVSRYDVELLLRYQRLIEESKDDSRALEASTIAIISTDYLISLDDPEINEFIAELGDYSPSDPYFQFIIEQLKLLLIEVIRDFIPGASTLTLGPEALNLFNQGKWLEALSLTFEIILNEADIFLGPGKVLTSGIELGIGISKIYKRVPALKNLAELGDLYFDRIINTMKKVVGDDFLKKIKKVDRGGGAHFPDVSAESMMDELKDVLDVEPTMVLGEQLYPIFKVGDIPFSNKFLYIELYPDSKSGFAWTIEISKGPENLTSGSQLTTVYKIRFDLD